MADNILEIKDLTKNFGSKYVLNQISFSLSKGKVLGILSPNGRGKTTLLNIISGLMKPTSGNILICNESQSVNSKRLISYLQEKEYLPRTMSVDNAVNFYKGFFPDFQSDKISVLLDDMKILPSMKLKSLSKGTMEKLNLALTLSRKSSLYILDEPISGVDIISRDKILNTIINHIDEDSSMIITSHYVGELENIFDEVIFLGDGTIIESGNAEDLRIKYGTSIEQIYRKIFAE